MDRRDWAMAAALALVAAATLTAAGGVVPGYRRGVPLAIAGLMALGWCVLLWRLVRLRRRLDTLQRACNRQQERLEHESALAAAVHESLIPPPTQAGPFRIDIRHLPLEGIGGDTVNLFVDAERGTAHVGVGDVTGHGTAAALLVNRIHHESESLLRLGLPPDEVLRRLNRLISRTFTRTEMLMTFAVVTADLGAGRVTWANGGHPPPLLWHAATGAVSLLNPQATILGLADDLPIDDPPLEAEPLAAGDRLVLYTDGIIDALSPASQRFGMDRLIALVQETLGGDSARAPAEIGSRIVQHVQRFAQGPLQDDALVVTVAVDPE